MTSFILIASLITLATIALLIWPLRKNRNSTSYARQAQNIHYAKERLQELEQQLKNADISATDYEALKLEIESTLADDIDIENTQTKVEVPHSSKPNKSVIITLCILLPLSATGFYALTGTPESFANETVPVADNGQIPQAKPQEINSMLASVEQRLKDNPNDIEGWTILTRSYFSLGRYHDAKQGYKKLIELQGETPELLVSLADASGLAAGGNMFGEPLSYVQRALEIDPEYPQGLWLAGVGAIQIGDTDTAIGYWDRLVPYLENSPQQQQELRDLITETKQRASGTPPATTVASNTTTPQTDEVAEDVEHKQDTPNGIRVTVSLDPALKGQVSPTDTVFVFAKATQGPPAPLAVKRLTVADLPASIVLNDEDAMLAQFKLSLFENVSISARVAKGGNPIAQAGDLESETADVKNDTKESVKITISTIVK